MDFEFTPQEQAFRAEAAAYIREHGARPGVQHYDNYATRYVDTPARREFMKALARGGYLGISWPKEYGGRGLDTVYDYLLNEELALQGMPGTGKGVGIIGRTLMLRGTEAQKKKFLPLILNAEIEWAIGYSEPEAGSDLAALKLRAVRDGAGWRLNGQKRFTTSAHFADWYFLAARTDFNVPRHQGITLFLVDLKTPGITVNAMHCIDNERTNEVFLDDVWVSDEQVIGEVGKGFTYVSQALDFERHILLPVGIIQRMYDAFVEWAKTAVRDGRPVREDPDVRRALGRLTIGLEMIKVMNLKVLACKDDLAQGTVASAMNKIFHSEYQHLLADTALDLMGPGAWIGHGQPGAPADGLFELIRRTAVLATVGAGTSEVQRNIIARRGLGLPNPT